MTQRYVLPLERPTGHARNRRRQRRIPGAPGERGPARARRLPRDHRRLPRLRRRQRPPAAHPGRAGGDQPDRPGRARSRLRPDSPALRGGSIPDDIAAAIRSAYAELPNPQSANPQSPSPVAVRSSATAEDLPEASFAGQQETFLNVSGADAVLAATVKCWASLWTARAIAYRARQGIAPESVALAVVVQRLVPAEAAGILFTANPITGRRDQVVISAVVGPGRGDCGRPGDARLADRGQGDRPRAGRARPPTSR